ncbi:hypothetical protein QBC32DRAFT_399984 [Pseudoneurospora amorphoporcata]|uniref:Uncharacterized protein n=1 Tax=Pseudoneurospora amorphoporcata TaxID=241081 RepID=A0AAN6NRK0_9PEZI|nr:hypothetical protein QBC32DRAFT_399984 [Pseudoneurospora amorphoporcata]
MSDQNLPETPGRENGRNARISDYFKSIERTKTGKKSKRGLEDQQKDAQPAKKPKNSNNNHTDSSKTIRHRIDVDDPQPKKSSASARLLDEADGGLADSVSTEPVQTLARAVEPKRKTSASSRLLDDTDRGLADTLAGRPESPRQEEDFVIFEDAEEREKENPSHGAVDDILGEKTADDDTQGDDSEAETIRAWDSENEMSSGGDLDDDGDEEDVADWENSEDSEDSEEEDTQEEDSEEDSGGSEHNQGHETADATPSSQPSDSPSFLLLPSPAVDLSPLPSSPVSSPTLVPDPSSTLPSTPSWQ